MAERRKGRSMTEAEATALTTEIEKWRRFKVTGRKTVAGVGLHLRVIDQSTGFKHDIHDAAHWREVMSWSHLNVYGTLEDALVDAMGKFREDASRPIRSRQDREQRAFLLVAARDAERLLARFQERAYGLATGRKQIAQMPDGEGSIVYVPERPKWRGYLKSDGRGVHIWRGSGSREKALAALAEAIAAHTAAGHTVSEQRVCPGIQKERFIGSIWTGERTQSVTAKTYELCLERLMALRTRLASEGGINRRNGVAITEGSVRPDPGRANSYLGRFHARGQLYQVRARTYDECRAKFETKKAAVLALAGA